MSNRLRSNSMAGAGFSALLIAATWSSAATVKEQKSKDAKDRDRGGVLKAIIIATGIPGAGAVAEVGDFLRGSPLKDNAALSPFAQPAQILDAKRVLVASTSNFGAPLARLLEPEGSIISIDPAAGSIAVPAAFAQAGNQASTFNGALQMYAAQSPAFLNSVKEPQAVTADLPSASLPTGISINNGNGRPWLSNAPNGANGAGTITVLDPQGYPLAGAPNQIAGGVFAANLTNRDAKTTRGLTNAALGTAILTKSPDLTGRAVFVAVQADGSVVQINVLKGVDGLAPPGTVTAVKKVDRAAAESTDPKIAAREGMAFNWVPSQNVFIADPQANRLVVLDLTDDGTMFSATRREIVAAEFNMPIDVTPTTREISHGSFASNSTLGGGSDLYVLNRGNNSIVRIGLGGNVQAVRSIQADVPGFRVNGIGVASDGQSIYVTATTPQSGGVLMVVPAFGAKASTSLMMLQARTANMASDMTSLGTFLFSLKLSPSQGLGPLFNNDSCAGCHDGVFVGGMGANKNQQVHRVGRILPNGDFDSMSGRGGPVARERSVSEMGVPCAAETGIPPQATIKSLRNPMSLRGNGLIDTIALGDMIANMNTQPAAVRGRPNILPDGRVGKFGWKANVATVVEFMGEAFRNELGVTNPLQPTDQLSGCGANRNAPEVDGFALQATAKFLNTIDAPAPAAACIAGPAAAIFQTAGCATCHTPSLPGPGARQAVQLYSDLLLHDMGSVLGDRVVQGLATGNEWRTMPLWRVSERTKFLHDGSAPSLTDAISAHSGQAQTARDAFFNLSSTDRLALMAFLGCI